jgi:hypothetical protein
MSETQRRELVAALVSEKFAHLYHGNVFFHQTVDALVGLLPLWIDAIAADSMAAEAARREHVEALMAQPNPMLDPEDAARTFRLLGLRPEGQ